MYTYCSLMWRFDRETQNSVKQLSFILKKNNLKNHSGRPCKPHLLSSRIKLAWISPCELSYCQSAQTLLTKYQKLSGLNNKNLFLIVLEIRKFKIKVPPHSVFSKVPLFLGCRSKKTYVL